MAEASMDEFGVRNVVPNCTVHSYGEHALQTLSVWPLIPASIEAPSPSKFWVIYVHGGAWRDPLIDNTSMLPTLTALFSPQNHDTFVHNVAAVASIDYRLSAHPDFPQDPKSVPATAYRNAKHPDHINDVCAALDLLQQTYGFGNNYILVGHSCGATLAFQTLMRGAAGLPSPSAVVGACGIYDLKLIVDNHASSPYAHIYQDFATGAFGADQEVWDRVSPAHFPGFAQWGAGDGEARKKVVVLASSVGDELVEQQQLDVMQGLLQKSAPGLLLKTATGLQGNHADVWSNGVELAECIMIAIRALARQ